MRECVSPIFLRKYGTVVPCSRCGNCLDRMIQDRSIRCQVEAKNSLRSYFVTLTYEKDPLQLYKRDLQGFFKRLRKVGAKFSYFALGDYGDKFGRPHYHCIFFVKGFFPAEYLSTLWQAGDQTRRRGFVHVRPLTIGRIFYTVRYGYLAKVDWDKDDKRCKPFFLMSKRPALGSQYLTKAMRRYHRKGNIWYYRDNGFVKALPRYYRDKLFYKWEREAHAIAIRDDVHLESKRNAFMEEKSKGYVGSKEKWYNDTLWTRSDSVLSNLRRLKKLKSLI